MGIWDGFLMAKQVPFQYLPDLQVKRLYCSNRLFTSVQKLSGYGQQKAANMKAAIGMRESARGAFA